MIQQQKHVASAAGFADRSSPNSSPASSRGGAPAQGSSPQSLMCSLSVLVWAIRGFARGQSSKTLAAGEPPSISSRPPGRLGCPAAWAFIPVRRTRARFGSRDVPRRCNRYNDHPCFVRACTCRVLRALCCRDAPAAIRSFSRESQSLSDCVVVVPRDGASRFAFVWGVEEPACGALLDEGRRRIEVSGKNGHDTGEHS